MKRFFALFLAITVLAVSLPLALFVGAQQPDFNEIFAEMESTPAKTIFDNSTAVGSVDGVVSYNAVERLAAGLSVRENNYIKPSTTSESYVVLEVNGYDGIETGLVIGKDRLNDTSLEFYVSTDNTNWTAVESSLIASEQDTCTTVLNNSNYYLRKQRLIIGENIRYIKIKFNTAQTWQPGLDYVDFYKIDKFKTALDGYESTPVKTYFDIKGEALNTIFPEDTYYNDVTVKERGSSVGGRAGDNAYGVSLMESYPSGHTKDPYVIIPVNDINAIETGLVIQKDNLTNAELEFYTSANMQDWQAVPAQNVSAAVLDKSAVPTLNDSFRLRKQRITNLPQGTEYIKISINATSWWFNILDYVDVYKPADFDVVLEGYEESPYKTYFDTKGEALGTIFPEDTYYNDVITKERGSSVGSRTNDGAYGVSLMESYPSGHIKAPYVIIPVTDSDLIEAGLVVHKDNTANANLVFYTSADKENWTAVSLNNISTKVVDNTQVSTLNANYYLRKQRISSLPVGTKYVKIYINATSWWHNILDYVDVYKLDRFESCLNGYEAEPVKTYFNDNTKIDTKGFVAGYSNVAVKAQGLSATDKDYLKAETAEGGWVAVKIEENNVIETGLVINKGQIASTYLEFFTSADMKSWIAVDNINISASEQNCTINNDATSYLIRTQRVYNLPKGAKYVKVQIHTSVAWQPGLDFIKIYQKEGTNEAKAKLYNSLLDGYTLTKSILSKTETLDSTSILSYDNWRFTKDSFPYRDAYATQRPADTYGDAQLVLSVSDNTAVEIGTVISESYLTSSKNTYYASADGKEWTELDETSVYVKELDSSAEKPQGYDGLKAGYVVRIERIVRLPSGTTQIKMVNTATTWWQPGIEYIDLYEPTTEIKLDGEYEPSYELITKDSKLDDEKIVSYKNWKYIDNGVALEDTYSLGRENAENAEVVVGISANTPVMFGLTVPAADYEKLKVNYYSSVDGSSWKEIPAEKLISRKILSEVDINLIADYCGKQDLILALSDDVKFIKAVVAFDTNDISKDVQLNYIKLYKKYINPFDTIISGYSVVETLLTPTNTIEAQSILSYENWRFGKMGMPFFDEVGTQRPSNFCGDASIVLSVDDQMAVEVATVIAKSLEGCTSNTYFASADGIKWTEIPAENIYSKRFVAAEDNLLNKDHICLMERIVGLPSGTTMVKIVTSTQNKVNSWWQPSINQIRLYKDPFDLSVDGCVVVDKAITPTDKLGSERIVSTQNFTYSNIFPYENEGGAVRNSKSDATITLSVVDSMTVEVATVANTKLQPHTYFVSADGKNWTQVKAENIASRTFKGVEKLQGDTVATVERIFNLPAGTIYLKIVSSGSEDFAINGIKFYDKAADKYNLAFVGYGRTDTLFDAKRKLNDTLVTSYENWRYGQNGYEFTDVYSLQREKDNSSDANLVLSVKDNQLLEYGFIISNSWLKKTVTTYYTSADGTKWTQLDGSNILKKYYTTEQDARVKEGYNVLAERIIKLPESTAFIKCVVSTGGASGSWWQPGVDYVDIYTPFENYSLEQIAAQAGEKGDTIQFTSDEDGLKNAYVNSSKNLLSGKFGLKYTDEYTARRVGYNDSEIVLNVDEDTIIELGTIIDKSLEYCAENKFYTSVDGENWLPFDAGMLLNAKITEGVIANTFARVQLLSELPADTKLVKIVNTTNGVTEAWKNFALDYITIYKGSSDFKIKKPLDNPQIMLVGNFMTIMMQKGQKYTVDDLTDRIDAGKLLVYYYTDDDVEICDGMTLVEAGQKLVLKRNNKTKKEYIISISYTDKKPADKTDAAPMIRTPIIIAIAVSGAILIAGAVLLIIYLKRKKLRA